MIGCLDLLLFKIRRNALLNSKKGDEEKLADILI